MPSFYVESQIAPRCEFATKQGVPIQKRYATALTEIAAKKLVI